MKRRTYSIFEIWRNYGQENQELIRRTEDWNYANQLLTAYFNGQPNGHNDKFYILEVQVLVKVERDELPSSHGDAAPGGE